MGHTFDARNIEIWVYTFYMLNVAHVKKNYFVDDFMRNSNFGIGVLHVKVRYLRLLLLFHLIGHTKRCLQKNIDIFL